MKEKTIIVEDNTGGLWRFDLEKALKKFPNGILFMKYPYKKRRRKIFSSIKWWWYFNVKHRKLQRK